MYKAVKSSNVRQIRSSYYVKNKLTFFRSVKFSFGFVYDFSPLIEVTLLSHVLEHALNIPSAKAE
jgi:hypothetical protein